MKLPEDEQIDLLDWVKDVLLEKAKGQDKEYVEEVIKSFKKGDMETMTYAIGRYIDREIEKGIEEKAKEIERIAKKEKDEEITKNLINIGFSNKQIIDITGLSDEDITDIRNNLPE